MKTQESLEFKLNKQNERFSFSPPINLADEGNWLVAVTSFEATNSLSNINYEHNNFSSSSSNYWTHNDGEEFINEESNLLDLRSQNDFELRVREEARRGNRIEIEKNGYK